MFRSFMIRMKYLYSVGISFISKVFQTFECLHSLSSKCESGKGIIKLQLGNLTEWSALRSSPISGIHLGHVTRRTGKSASFTNRTWKSRRDGSAAKSKRFLLFCCMDFSVCSLNACNSCIPWGGNSVPYTYCVLLNVLLY